MAKQAGGAYPWWQRTGDRAALWAFSSLLSFAISLVSLLRGGTDQPPEAD